jgi:hypothetical protein
LLEATFQELLPQVAVDGRSVLENVKLGRVSVTTVVEAFASNDRLTEVEAPATGWLSDRALDVNTDVADVGATSAAAAITSMYRVDRIAGKPDVLPLRLADMMRRAFSYVRSPGA